MRLDRGRVGRARLDHVRVQGALHQVPGVLVLESDLLEQADEELPDGLALLLGIGEPGKGLEEPFGGLHMHEVDGELVEERLFDLLALAFAHQPGVDEDRRELVADGPVDQGGGDGRVDAPDRAHSTCPEPTWARTASSADAITEACVQVGPHPQTSKRNRLSRSWPRSVCTTSGWNWTP